MLEGHQSVAIDVSERGGDSDVDDVGDGVVQHPRAGQDFVSLDDMEQGFAVSVKEVGGGELWSDSPVPYNWLPGTEMGFTLGDQDELAAGQDGCPGTNE